MMSAAFYLLLLGVVEVTRMGEREVHRSRRDADSVLLEFDSTINKLILKCEKGTYSCSTMSEVWSVFESSVGMATAAPEYLQVFNCSLGEPFACALGAINATNVKTLILSRTRGELLPRHVAGLTSVKELRMYSVETSMPYTAASRLPALSTFIASSGYFHVKEEPDQHLLQLRTLVLSDVQLKVLPARGFTSTPNLVELILVGNQIHIIGKGAFEGLCSLKQLLLYNNSINELVAGSFSDVKLEGLYLEHNKIEKLPLGVFDGQAALKILEMSENSIRYAPAGVFNDLANLTSLSLRDNKLEQLESYSFDHLHSLFILELSYNVLTSISPSTFKGLRSLFELDLSHNLLTSFSLSTFYVLQSLQVLNVSHNMIHMPCRDWHKLPKLEMLDLSHNVITRLTREDMMWNPSVIINFSHNNITNIKMHKFTEFPYLILNNNPFNCDCTLYPFIKAVKNNDQKFSLSDKTIICTSPPGLAGRLVSNVLGDLQRCLTCPNSCSCAMRSSSTTDVYELNCSSVPLYFPSTDLPFQLILNNVPKNITNLPAEVKYLIMSNLSMIELPYIEACSEVDLRHNLLTEAPLNLLKANCSVKLAHNPFECDCDNQQTFMLLKKYDNLIIDLSEVTCGDRLAIKNYRVEELCVTRDSILLGISIAAGLLVFGVCVILIYAKKITIRLYMIRYGLYYPRQTDRSDSKYDAYVSFEDEDERYVYHQLLPKLESGRCPLSLCIPCRDWEVGGLISEQISRSVQESRVTLVVLSAHYGKSTWRKIEFRTARALHNIIVLVMDDVANRCSKLGLETYTSMNKCVKASDPLVWCKIKQAVGARDEGS